MISRDPETRTRDPDTKKRKTQKSEGKEPPNVSLIGANAFAFVCNQPGMELYFITVEEANAAHLASQEMGAPELEPNLSSIPPEYHEFADLFSKKEADKISVH